MLDASRIGDQDSELLRSNEVKKIPYGQAMLLSKAPVSIQSDYYVDLARWYLIRQASSCCGRMYIEKYIAIIPNTRIWSQISMPNN